MLLNIYNHKETRMEEQEAGSSQPHKKLPSLAQFPDLSLFSDLEHRVMGCDIIARIYCDHSPHPFPKGSMAIYSSDCTLQRGVPRYSKDC